MSHWPQHLKNSFFCPIPPPTCSFQRRALPTGNILASWLPLLPPSSLPKRKWSLALGGLKAHPCTPCITFPSSALMQSETKRPLIMFLWGLIWCHFANWAVLAKFPILESLQLKLMKGKLSPCPGPWVRLPHPHPTRGSRAWSWHMVWSFYLNMFHLTEPLQKWLCLAARDRTHPSGSGYIFEIQLQLGNTLYGLSSGVP